MNYAGPVLDVPAARPVAFAASPSPFHASVTLECTLARAAGTVTRTIVRLR